MTAQPRHIPPAADPAPHRGRPRVSRTVKAVGATVVSAGLVAGGVTATQAFAEPEQSTQQTPRGGQTAGSVFANRPVADTDLAAGASSGQQFSYWTQGSDDRMHLSTAVLLEPQGAAPSGGWPVVAYAHAPAGLASQCGPTQSKLTADVATVSDLLRGDYAVIVPDYSMVGVAGSPQYVDYGSTADGLVDAVSAASDVEPSLSSKWAAVGEGLGAGAAVQLAQSAASSQPSGLDFRGATATTLPVGYDEVVTGLSPRSAKVSAGTVTEVVYTLASVDSEQVEPLLTQRGRNLVQKARQVCAPALTKAIGGTNLADLVRKAVSSDSALLAELRKALALPSSGFSRPIMLSQKLVDDETDVPASLQYVTTAQLASNKVAAKTYLTGDARDADRQEKAAQADFLKKLF
ncbi:alpha/beta hydrolase [Gordonia humi]|uniref:Lipase n=1 Tax=Gordonia humi TaxID=686429 RepID=A0A840F485_9ACTN|nr:alpha/beta hydrolase [Gordonia humi]MBB4137313.1 hypothetical protein [Gordonia humi]